MRGMRTIARLTALLVLAGCSEDHGGHDHDPNAGHAHYSTHGGMRIEIGDHLGSLDLVLDAEAGELRGYVGNADMKPVRTDMLAIRVRARVDGNEVVLVLEAQADKVSGEKVGDTSYFLARHASLKGAKSLSGTIERVSLYGQDFPDIDFTYAPDHTD
jgi:hypothetical protein